MTSSATIARERLGTALAVDRAVQAATAQVKASLEFQTVSSSDVRSGAIFGALPTDAGAMVNEHSAMRVAAVYAAVRLIAGTVATLPWHVYKRHLDGSRERLDHDLWWKLNEEACPLFTSAAMWMVAVSQTLLRGDGLVMIDRGGRFGASVQNLIPLRRDMVMPFRTEGGRNGYRVFNDDGKGGYFTLSQDDVLHFTGDFFNGLTSLSVIQSAARQSIGVALRADQHAARAFGDGAYLQYVLKAPKQLNVKTQEELRAAFVAKYSGGPGVSPVPLVLTEGMDLDKISLSPADQQLLETRKWQVADIARAFGVPPHMIGDVEKSSSWGTGIEQMYLGFVRGQQPLLARITQELNRKFFRRSGVFIEADLSALTAGDAKTQAEFYAKALGGPGTQGWMQPNEVRRKFNLPPVEGGDKLIIASGPAPKPDDKPKDPPPDPEDDPTQQDDQQEPKSDEP